MKAYKELSRRGRLRRLRQVAKSALEAYGLEEAKISFIQYGENCIFRVDAPGRAIARGEAGPFIPNRYILRVLAINDIETITSELTWLRALSQEAGLAVPAPVMTLDGELMTSVTIHGIPNNKVVSMMCWLDGRRFLEGLQPNHLRALGMVVGEMHKFSASWQPPQGFARFTWDWPAQLGGSMFSHPMEEVVRSMPPSFQGPFIEVSQKVKELVDQLGKGPEAFGLVHGDLYPETVLYKAGQAYPIDFEDCGYSYWMWDIAVALCQWAWNGQWERMRDAFHDGYSHVRWLPAEQWDQLDLFVASHFATMVLWSSAFLMRDPKRAAEYEPWRDRNGDKLLRFYNR